MRCERMDALLPAYLDGDLPGRLNRSVSDHLDACERCRDELAAQQRALRQLDAGRYPVTIDLWADFSRRLQVQNRPAPTPWRPYCRPGYAAALGAAAVALVALTAPRPGSVATPDTASRVAVVASVPRPSRVLPALARPTARAATPSPLRGRAHGSYQLAMAAPADHLMPVSRKLRRHEMAPPVTAHTVERPAGRRASSQQQRRPDPPMSPEPRAILVATRPELSSALAGIDVSANAGRMSVEPERSLMPPVRPTVLAARTHRFDSSAGVPARAGDPLRVAEALVSVEQDAASDQMKGELLRLAQEVARVGGEAGAGSPADTAASDASTATEPASPPASLPAEEGGGGGTEASSRAASQLVTPSSSGHGD